MYLKKLPSVWWLSSIKKRPILNQNRNTLKQNKFWLKLTGAALLLHVALIFLSIIEVVIYSYLVDPGHEEVYYSRHATRSGPWISMVFGSVFMFLIVRRYLKRYSHRNVAYALGLPVLYTVIDLLIVIAAGADLKNGATVLFTGTLVKFSAAFLAYFVYSNRQTAQRQVSGE
jgi:hypothetical protein